MKKPSKRIFSLASDKLGFDLVSRDLNELSYVAKVLKGIPSDNVGIQYVLEDFEYSARWDRLTKFETDCVPLLNYRDCYPSLFSEIFSVPDKCPMLDIIPYQPSFYRNLNNPPVISGIKEHANDIAVDWGSVILQSQDQTKSHEIKLCRIDDLDVEYKVLNGLVSIKEKLEQSKNEALDRFSNIIGQHLDVFEETGDSLQLSKAAALVQYFSENIGLLKEKYFIKRKAFGKKLQLSNRRDLRQVFRKIIRFLFKNMDSESHSVKRFVNISTNFFMDRLKIHLDGQKRGYQIF